LKRVGEYMNESELYEYTIEILSPTIVASGGKLQRIDFIQRGTRIEILDMDKTLADRSSLELFERANYNLETFRGSIKDGKIKYEKKYDLQFTGSGGKNLDNIEIIEHIKSAGRPYLPGSSIKGALRSTITRAFGKDNVYKMHLKEKITEVLTKNPRGGERALKEVGVEADEQIFGSPTSSPFKLLVVSDSSFAENSSLQLSEIVIQNIKKRENLLPLYAETLSPGTKLTGTLIRKYRTLYSKEKFVKEIEIIESMAEKSRASNSILLEREIEKLSKSDPNKFRKIIEFYKKLLMMNKEKGTILLCMGFSSGYFSKIAVGNPDSEFLQDVQKLMNLSNPKKQISSDFPVSRKFVTDSMGLPAYPLGWIKMTLSKIKS